MENIIDKNRYRVVWDNDNDLYRQIHAKIRRGYDGFADALREATCAKMESMISDKAAILKHINPNGTLAGVTFPVVEACGSEDAVYGKPIVTIYEEEGLAPVLKDACSTDYDALVEPEVWETAALAFLDGVAVGCAQVPHTGDSSTFLKRGVYFVVNDDDVTAYQKVSLLSEFTSPAEVEAYVRANMSPEFTRDNAFVPLPEAFVAVLVSDI